MGFRVWVNPSLQLLPPKTRARTTDTCQGGRSPPDPVRGPSGAGAHPEAGAGGLGFRGLGFRSFVLAVELPLPCYVSSSAYMVSPYVDRGGVFLRLRQLSQQSYRVT